MARDLRRIAQTLRTAAQGGSMTREEADAFHTKAGEFSDAHDQAVRDRAQHMPSPPGNRGGKWGPTYNQYMAAQRQMDAERERDTAECTVEVVSRDGADREDAGRAAAGEIEARGGAEAGREIEAGGDGEAGREIEAGDSGCLELEAGDSGGAAAADSEAELQAGS